MTPADMQLGPVNDHGAPPALEPDLADVPGRDKQAAMHADEAECVLDRPLERAGQFADRQRGRVVALPGLG